MHKKELFMNRNATIAKLRYLLLFNFLLFFVYSYCCAHSFWSHSYSAQYVGFKKISQNHATQIFMTQENIPHFKQLIFSWNALRPSQGFFSFWVQVRDATTKKWGSWHHMYDWGNGIQKSYKSSSDGISRYEHARLELESNKFADGFKIKVTAFKGADLSLLHRGTVTLSDVTQFKAESPEVGLLLRSVYIKNIPKIAQFGLDHSEKHRICSPVSVTMLLHSLGYTQTIVDTTIEKAYDSGLDAFGSWAFNTAHAFESSDGKHNFSVRRMNSFVDLHKQLLKGIPVVLSVRGFLPGAERPYAGGHLLLLIGFDNSTQEVIVHDPAFDSDEKTLKRYPLSYFLLAWERSRRLVYWVD